MPNIHVSDWNTVKLSDFPTHKCLCELCDCGCFERTNRAHSKKCNKNDLVIGPYYMNSEPYESNYKSNYKNNAKMEKRVYFGEQPGNISFHDKNKLLPMSTNNDTFKYWDSYNQPTQGIIPESEEVSGELLYPTRRRRHLTTNDELYQVNNYGNHRAKQTGNDQFAASFNLKENNYRLNEDTKLKNDERMISKKNLSSSNTVYRDDFLQTSRRDDLVKQRGEIVTKQKFENSKTHKQVRTRIPMETKTNNMRDFREFDNDLYRNILKKNTMRHSANIFESSLNPGLKPPEKETPGSIYGSRSANFNMNHQNNNYSKRNSNFNINYTTTIDNKYIPTFKVDQQVNNQSRNIARNSFSHNGSPDSFSTTTESNNNNPIDDTPDTIYMKDFKSDGVDLCMSKAINKLGRTIYDPLLFA